MDKWFKRKLIAFIFRTSHRVITHQSHTSEVRNISPSYVEIFWQILRLAAVSALNVTRWYYNKLDFFVASIKLICVREEVRERENTIPEHRTARMQVSANSTGA